MAEKLREGFTTGSAATGAALAALQLLRTGTAPDAIPVPLPPFRAQGAHNQCKNTNGLPEPRGWLRLKIEHCAAGPAPELGAAWAAAEADAANGLADPPPPDIIAIAHASIIKDGGDDPDATSGARITATVVESALPPTHLPANQAEDAARQAPAHNAEGGSPDTTVAYPDHIIIKGGPGVGRVTLPGLPVPVGQAAVNPVPRQQITYALQAQEQKYAAALQCRTRLTVFVSVPAGAQLAHKTFNPRLGIEGGISILGTQGTVRPFSHDAWKATIEQGLAVARATGCHCACLTTGRRSERLLMERYPDLPERCFVQVADFAQFSLQAVGSMQFERIIWGCFFGKLVKLAQGHTYTHAKDSTLDMQALAQLASEAGAGCADAITRCVTAAHALELLLADSAGAETIKRVAQQAARTAQLFAGRPVSLHLFHTDGRELLAL
ncbi:cobalt-precorrin-5B (C(1))-methyltransferase CbiD [Desulfovibrio desulfuricans]|uniref:cobalt-precorrin-5B (C(1))-methyltransferase CbiD n=1 Tax=Desulfovibrio desulfuricans TaxID=876 RepID=UPI001C00D71D|nr:cobalt-precorrin-5B (C(1))-methyltransferase CbiD [Desulfovibrio desulfuricans]MBT9749556.1 cobalt-precorrin-5B (C(1))-methyltransferase [Desulfovibrio desulfuricans]